MHPNGRPSFSVGSCVASADDLDVKFHNGRAFIYNKLVEFFIGDIRKDISRHVKHFIHTTI
jgi:hypothetical protein